MNTVAVVLAATLGLLITACAADKSAQATAVPDSTTHESTKQKLPDADRSDPGSPISGRIQLAGDPSASARQETPGAGDEAAEPAPAVAQSRNGEEPVRDAKEAAEEAARKIYDATVEAASRIKEAGISAVQAVRDTTTRNNAESGSSEKDAEVAANGIEDSETRPD